MIKCPVDCNRTRIEEGKQYCPTLQPKESRGVPNGIFSIERINRDGSAYVQNIDTGVKRTLSMHQLVGMRRYNEEMVEIAG